MKIVKETEVSRVLTSLPSTSVNLKFSVLSDRAPQLHQVAVVGLVLHDVANLFIDDHLADDVCAQRAQDACGVATPHLRYTSL